MTKLLSSSILVVLAAGAWGQVTLGQTDTFNTNTQSWAGANPSWTSTGGPAGAGDGFLQLHSIGGSGPVNEETHTILLGAGIWVVEELRFPAEVFSLPQPLKFWAMPLNWPGCSGAFCRPVVEIDG